MKTTWTWMLVGLLALPLAVACGDDDGGGDASDDGTDDGTDDGVEPVCDGDVIDVTEDIEADATWTADNVYCLNTHIFVRGATLTVDPGTTILGGVDSSLVITTSGLLDAQGTADAPIVFTSAQPGGTRAAGDWGGVVLLGLAGINVEGGESVIEGFDANTIGIEYGGGAKPVDTHDCGALTYVRIEFAGFELSPDNELNGLTLGGCGSDTLVDFVQIHLGADDGIEFFGGTASFTHVVVTQPDDDGLDWDFGWAGTGQFLIVQQNADVGNHAIEADNNEDDPLALPVSNPLLWNLTLIGSGEEPGTAGKTQGAMMLRRGTMGEIHNTIAAFFTDFAIDIDNPETVDNLETGDLLVTSGALFDNAGVGGDGFPVDLDEIAGDDPGDGDYDEGAFFLADITLTFDEDPLLEAPLDLAAPSFFPDDLSPVLGAGEAPPAGFDTAATFIGAVGDVDWTEGWTAYPAD